MVFATLACLCFVVMCVTVGVQILGRYAFNFPIAVFAELATYAQVWLGILGAGWALRAGSVFAIDSLVSGLSLGMRRVVVVLNTLLCLGFIAILIYGSTFLIEIGAFQSSPTLGIPMWILYSVIPVGMSYFGFEIVVKAVETWDAPFRGAHEPVLD